MANREKALRLRLKQLYIDDTFEPLAHGPISSTLGYAPSAYSELYLFDTFEGFDKRDISVERNNSYSEELAGHLNITGEQLVLSKLPHPDMCVILKGYFPETAEGIDEEFCFVNLDFDLYKPILAGLEFFVPRMVRGGVILIHDYFNPGYLGVKEAIKAFEDKCGSLSLFPIGDGSSIAITPRC